MNTGANQPQPQNPDKRGRRRRRRGGHKGQQPAAGAQQPPRQQSQQASQPRSPRPPRQHPGGGGPREANPGNNRRQGSRQRRGPAAFVGPMDHSYRGQNGDANGNGNFNGNRAHAPLFHQPSPFADVEGELPAVAVTEDAPTRIYAFIEELFFLAKIQEISRKLNVKVQFVKSEKELFQQVEELDVPPALIIFDLNNANAKPLVTIPKLRKEFKKGTSILGFVSHVQGDLKIKALEAGCDSVMPRSAFSQNLVGLLRRHGLPEELQEMD